MNHAQELIDGHDKLARLTSSLDAVEMTVDPVFEVNDDMASTVVSSPTRPTWSTSAATETPLESRPPARAHRRPEIDLPSEQWMEEHNRSDFEFLSDLGTTKAQIIEQMNASGDPVVLFDDTEHQFDLTDEHNAWVRSLLGCGCNSGVPGAGVGLLAGAVALLVARRRRV